MIVVRHYAKSDFDAVAGLHARQGLDYQLPNLEDASMLVRTVIEEDGIVTHAAFLRKTCEAYWVFDPRHERNRDRLGRLLILQKEIPSQALQVGLDDVHCWIPPAIANKKFDATMLRLGWNRPLWTCYSKEVR